METTQQLREKAEHRVSLGFGIHAGVFVIVMAGLTILDLNRNPDRTWFYWPLAGWGAGLLAHGLCAFGSHVTRERMVERTMQRMEHRASA